MSINPAKIAFIICTNDDLYFSECENYLRRLIIPEGYEIEIMPVRGAVSMCSGYNAAMRTSDAKYKIYLHQDTFILNRYFIQNILSIFEAYPEAGMIGMVGNERLSDTGIMWRGIYKGNMYEPMEEPYNHERVIGSKTPVYRAECVDGFLIATQADLPWREDIFDGWDFYDASQSLEFRRAGYEILIPEQKSPWCMHDDGKILSLFRYDHYREVFLAEYGDELGKYAVTSGIARPSREKADGDVSSAVAGHEDTVPAGEKREESISRKSRFTDKEYLVFLKKLAADASILQTEIARIIGKADEALRQQDTEAFLAIGDEFAVEPGRTALTRSTELLRLKQMIEAVRTERQAGLATFIDGVRSYDAFREKYLRCTFAFRVIEFDLQDKADHVENAELEERESDHNEALKYLKEQRLSAFSAAAILYNIISLLGHREKILMTMALAILEDGDPLSAYQFLAAIQDPSADAAALRDELGGVLGR